MLAAVAALVLEVHALAGPYPDLAACLKKAGSGWGGKRCAVDPLATGPTANGVVEAGWLRCQVSIAGARGDDCALVLKTARGWYLDGEQRVRCAGRAGPLATVKGRLDPLAWKDGVLWATYRLETREGEWAAGPDGRKEAVEARPERNRWLVLCGAGPGGGASCSEALVLGCSSGGSSATVSAKLLRRTLVLEGNGVCDRGEITTGRFRVPFR